MDGIKITQVGGLGPWIGLYLARIANGILGPNGEKLIDAFEQRLRSEFMKYFRKFKRSLES